MNNILFENCAGSVASCIIAEKAGAGRIELCAGLTEGGTTPSYGMVKMALASVEIPIFPIIRPRSGDFLYTELELQQMEEDIRVLSQLGTHGFVTGALDADGNLDREANSRLIKAADGKPVTLHRAIDRASNILQAVEDAIILGFTRILTSGGKPNVTEGVDTIAEMVKVAKDRIIIMAGSGVRPDNARWLVEKTRVKELHGTLQGTQPSSMRYRNQAITSSTVTIDEYNYNTTNLEKVKELIDQVSTL